MAKNTSQVTQVVRAGTPLETDGRELEKGLWEVGVYLGADSFVYHLVAENLSRGLKITVLGKRAVGEYLRWVDGLFRPGEIPGESNAIHYRAARRLRELI